MIERADISDAALRCPECAYDLSHSLRGICPECGCHFKRDQLRRVWEKRRRLRRDFVKWILVFVIMIAVVILEDWLRRS